VTEPLGGYDPSFAKRVLMYAYAAYCPAGKLQQWNCYWCTVPLQSVKTIYDSGTNTFAYVGHDGSNIWVSVRGTQASSVVDWINNIDFFPTPLNGFPNCEVHSGFHDGFMALYPGIKSAFSELSIGPCKGCSAFVTGHSLGGAIANIVSLQLNADFGVSVQQLTFGTPRTGNSNFATVHNQRIGGAYRVVNKKDIVPRLPTHLVFDYHHCPTEVWYPPAGGYKVCDGSGEDPTCSLSIPFLDDDISDHLNYLGVSLGSGSGQGCA